VFDLENSQGRSMAAEGSKDAEQPVDAAAYARRGEASAQRGDFEQAIADLTRASDLDPNESEYFYQRGMAHWRNKQAEPAQADFDQALLLKPDDAPILMARAQLRITGNDIPGALTDLDAADSSAPKQADYRFSLGMLYERADRFQSAVAQYDLWIANHSDDRKLPSAYSKRCWARMMQGVNLDKALSDCNFAVRTGDRAADYAELRYSRGFIRLRMGELNKAISDFDASVKSDPKNASALYGRGLARQRQGNHAQADADISAAITMDPKVTEYFDRHGITH
jgi:tetratricopeptide (TPR) repeat protein